MRRSKSDPAKYARNYRSISQRQMTQFDESVDEEEEIRRLRAILQSSERHLKRIEEPISSSRSNSKNKPQRQQKRKAVDDDEQNEDDEDNDDQKMKKKSFSSSVLSAELLAQSSDMLGGDGGDGSGNELVLLSTKKKKKQKTKAIVMLTPEEIREAKLLQKKTSKKLQQLEARAAQKKRRNELYKRLEETSLATAVSPSSLQTLLVSSGKLSRKESDTKKQTLKKLLNKERAGLTLTAEERDLLYPSLDINDDDFLHNNSNDEDSVCESSGGNKMSTTLTNVTSTPSAGSDDASLPSHDRKQEQDQVKKSSKKKRKHKNMVSNSGPKLYDNNSEEECKQSPNKFVTVNAQAEEDAGCGIESSKDDADKSHSDDSSLEKSTDKKDKGSSDTKSAVPSAVDFAAQMMASLTKLKTESSDTKQTNALSLEDSLKLDNSSNSKQSRYIPSNPTILKTAASLGTVSCEDKMDDISKQTVVEIQRPLEIEKSRYDLPVSTMEFEIIDTIRTNDVTIICGETGSGKSTQVPQFVYENGMTINPRCNSSESPSFIVGVTQPRRVAAVSTAKRICYEMGQGDGQTIRNGPGGNGNLVAYKTRYETAGMGKSTRVQFMTDGILLQEIQHDLLLRRYSVIILDETHERNLNTDVLIGLLSKAIPLRKKAAEEDPENIVPLKLVLMSATLRVEDFTKNDLLFPTGPPAVVSVPGRTFPVTIHHSKVTELDDYESAAYRKVCKIHRKLPRGGILVFLTGKAEIIRMVNRLRRVLNGDDKSKRRYKPKDVTETKGGTDSLHDMPRELDDEELDAEDTTLDDFDDWDTPVDDTENTVTHDNQPEDEMDVIPKKARILPLYSLLSAEDQAKVFAPVEDDERLIVIATNVAETSITIPGICYVVDSGRQKCRNYNSGTGVASYDVMWISKASANQRAGRAGRTSPGHCYRLYSSSLFSRHMDAFALPEILTRPLEDVVLAMKAMKVSNVAKFPFPTPPDRSQMNNAVKVLADIGCVDISNIADDGGDGVATRLGEAVSKLPLGVRYAKMLLVAAQAGVLDYAIVLVAILSEASPFSSYSENMEMEEKEESEGDYGLDIVDRNLVKEHEQSNAKRSKKWNHRGGDLLAAMLAVGAYTYAGRGAGGSSESLANRRFCDENGLNYTIMTRIQKMRSHLASIAKNRLASASGVAAMTGGFSVQMSPPNKLQERLLIQTIASGLLDHIAVLAPPGMMSSSDSSLRSAYILCTGTVNEPLFLDRTSTLYSKDYRQLPRWVCYDSILRKTTKDGKPLAIMKNLTPVEASWLGDVAKGTQMLTFGGPLPSPPPVYDSTDDVVLCSVATKFGRHGFEIPPVKRVMYNVLQQQVGKQAAGFQADDSYRWFARFLLEGKVFSELEGLELNDSPALITRRSPLAKVNLFVAALSNAGVDSARALRKHWAETNDKLLFKQLKQWIKADHQDTAKKIWIGLVQRNIKQFKSRKVSE